LRLKSEGDPESQSQGVSDLSTSHPQHNYSTESLIVSS